MGVRSAKEFEAYQLANELAMQIFEVSKRFPPEERYAMTSQVRCSSRSICLNLREAWAKRRYVAHFLSKLTGSDAENGETDSSIDFMFQCRYISADEHKELAAKSASVGRMLGSMIRNPDPFILPPDP